MKIQNIILIRGRRVMLDRDLANLYGVKTKVLIQAVKRNKYRFPSDFMFRLTPKEYFNLRSQIVTSSWGGLRYLPFVFTEQGVAMLSSVLNSKRAIMVNIAIMRAFVKLREILSTNKEIIQKLNEHESKIKKHDKEIKIVFGTIRQLMTPQKRPIGFQAEP